MKTFKKILKWIGISILGVILIIIVSLGIIGIPSPPAITAENVDRLPLSYAKEVYGLMSEVQDEVRLYNWSPYDESMYVLKIVKFRAKLHNLKSENDEPQIIEGLPNNARGYIFNPNPDKKYLLYGMDLDGNENHQYYRFDLETGKSDLITDGTSKHSFFNFNKSGNQIAFSSNERNQTDFDIYTMNPDSPDSKKLIYKSDGFWRTGNWSPNSEQIILYHGISVVDIKAFILDLNTSEKIAFVIDSTENAVYQDLLWNAEGTKMYYISDFKSEFKNLRVRDLETGVDNILNKSLNWDISNLEMSPNGKWLKFHVNEDGVGKLQFYNLENNTFEKIDNLPVGEVRFAQFHPVKENIIGFNLTRPSNSTSIYSYDLKKKKLTQWSSARDDINLPDPEIIHYPTFDMDSTTGKRREITAYLHRPNEDFDKPYPVVIFVHGGPESQKGINRNLDWIIPLNKGIAFIAPNVRGSTGYGKTFTLLDNGKSREDAVKDIGALLDWIADHPDLDEERVMISGGSYGGYMVLASAAHFSDRLLGGIDVVGISNFVSFLENTEEYRTDLRRAEYGDERDPEMRAFLEGISPINHVDKIDIPLLIIQGKNDPRVPVSESRQMVEQMKLANKKVWYVEASNEGHGFRQPMNAIYSTLAGYTFIEDLFETKE
ncbi:alpha/beta fold hydrolase [Marivirga sp.]|uniref:S9 family peptidase n=1 Tax=Marivirga sp. TaxID=2018662 RepID=UPI0025EDC435|nr:alpha/beta fold hydrolase [Marivirga sp.]